MYVGNDLNDLEVMRIVGFPVAPVDAPSENKKSSKIDYRVKGGRGCC